MAIKSLGEKVKDLTGLDLRGLGWDKVNEGLKGKRAKFASLGITLRDDIAQGINLGVDVIHLDKQIDQYYHKHKV